jgi:hypothetical protein
VSEKVFGSYDQALSSIQMEGATREVNLHVLAARVASEISERLEYPSFSHDIQVPVPATRLRI